jgi:hypothetical protein
MREEILRVPDQEPNARHRSIELKKVFRGHLLHVFVLVAEE